MEHKKYRTSDISKINIHEGLSKEQIGFFGNKENALMVQVGILEKSEDFLEALDGFDEFAEHLIESSAENWAIKTCIGKMQFLTKSNLPSKGLEYAKIICKICELNQHGLAEEVLEEALENVSEFYCHEWLANSTSSQDELNNKTLSLKIYKKAENLASDFAEFNTLANSIADEDYLGDKDYAITVFQKAENLADSFEDFLALGESYGLYIDKNHARKAFEKAEKLANGSNDLKRLAEKVADVDYLGDPVWEKRLLQKKSN